MTIFSFILKYVGRRGDRCVCRKIKREKWKGGRSRTNLARTPHVRQIVGQVRRRATDPPTPVFPEKKYRSFNTTTDSAPRDRYETNYCARANLRGLLAPTKGHRDVVRRLYGGARCPSESASMSLHLESPTD